MATKAKPYPDSDLFTPRRQRTYRGRNLLQIAMPLGGIGAGSISLNGQGGLQDFAIRHNPAISALADGHATTDAAFATLHLPKQGVTRLLEGPMPPERIYAQGLKGQGYRQGGYEGLPRLRECSFSGQYPFGTARLSDPDLPLRVEITGWSPFIPLDDRASSLPGLVLEYRFTNTSRSALEFEFAYHLSHLAPGAQPDFSGSRNEMRGDYGVFMDNSDGVDSPTRGSCALGLASGTAELKGMWFRGGWFDAISALWKELSSGEFHPNDGSCPAGTRGRNGASLRVQANLGAGKSMTIPLILTWHFPNVAYSHGALSAPQGGLPHWHPYYASQWPDAWAVLEELRSNYPALRRRTLAFQKALFRSSYPGYVLEALSANLAIIKSPTILRQSNGNMWAWEGCFTDRGCCHGSCTHVWNYAQAIPHLFPALERTFREQELYRSMDERGHVTFRSALPDGPTTHTYHPASDGQLGGVMKVYREWQISGDRAWLQEMYPEVKQSIDFCIGYWDPEHTGLLMEPHHNTYDIEFWGPDGMCSSFYIGALAAMAAIARDAGHGEEAGFYAELASRGAERLDKELFNGEYFEQKVMLRGLKASPGKEQLAQLKKDNAEEHRLLLSEGPKYQYGSGCISDGVFGAWLAKACGVESPQNRENIRRNLQAIFDYNFRHSLWEHANPQRPGYAIGDEPGLLLCTWPRGGKPTLPFVYSDEVWTGIEYQAAAHMIAEGLLREGLSVVKAARARYDGLARNPWNEYECGNFYARAMASWGLIQALSGFRYSAPQRTLTLEPQLEAAGGENFATFFSTAAAWGWLEIKGKEVHLHVSEGTLEIDVLNVVLNGSTSRVERKTTASAGRICRISF